MKPSQEVLRQQCERGGRIFLFTFPDHPIKGPSACLLPSAKALERIIDHLLSDLPAKEVAGPFINGTMAITVDDQQGGKLSDAQIIDQIVSIIYQYW